MRKLKKSVAFILCIALISSLCMFQMVASVAAEDETVPTVEITDSDLLLIEKLESFGVLANAYDPSRLATRREMAEIIAKYINLPSNGTATSSPFADVDASDSAIGAISGLYNMGIITGDENGNFCPDNYVTYDEALVFIINAIGHKMFAQRSGGYPTGYHRIAIQFDMLDDIAFASGKDNASIIDVYKMLNAAMSAATLETAYYGDGDVQYTLSKTETFLSENYGIRKYRGKVTGNSFTRLTTHEVNLKEEQIEIDGNTYDTPMYNYGDLLGYTVDYYVKDENKSEIIYIEETPKTNNTIRIAADDILKTEADRVYYEEEGSDKEQHIQFVANSDTDVIYNSECYIGYGWIENVIPEKGYIEALDNNNDDIYDVLFIYEYDTVFVKKVDPYDEIIVDALTDNEIDFTNDVAVYYADSSKITPFSSITSGSILGIPASKNGSKASKIYIYNEKVEGTITGYTSHKGYEINGKYYRVSDDYRGQTINIGISGAFLLDMYGDIIEYNYADDGDSVLAVPVGVHYKQSALDKTIIIKVFTEDGEFKEITLNDRLTIDGTTYNTTDETGHRNVLAKLCGSPDSNGLYRISRSYLIKYTVNKDGEMNSIDMGGSGNATNPVPGKVNIFADDYKVVRRCDEEILVLRKEDLFGDGAVSRKGNNAIYFMTPPAAEIDDTTKYEVVNNITQNKWYTHIDVQQQVNSVADVPILIETITAYNFGATDFRTVDAMVIRGGGGNSAASGIGGTTALNLVTEITNAVNEEGIATGRLYQGTRTLGMLAEQVTITTLDGEKKVLDERVSCGTVISENRIKSGDVVQLGYNAEGEINAIKLISSYNSTTKDSTPLFKEGGAYITQKSMFFQTDANFVVGTVNLCDASSGVLAFTADSTELVASVGSKPTVLIYYAGSNEVVEGRISDIQPEDKITMRVYNCYTVKEIIVFR